MAHRPDLEDHHAHGVGDHVVEFPGHPGAFLGHGHPGRRLPLPLGAGARSSAASACWLRSRRAKPTSQPTAKSTGVKNKLSTEWVGSS